MYERYTKDEMVIGRHLGFSKRRFEPYHQFGSNFVDAFMGINQTVCQLLRCSEIQDGGQPPYWIVEIAIFHITTFCK